MPQYSNVTTARQYSDLLKTLLDELFEDELPSHPKLYKAWLREDSSDLFVKTASGLTGLGAMPQKDIGGPISTDAPLQLTNKSFEMTTWGLGFVAEYELTRYDQWDQFGDMGRELVKSARDRCNIAAHAILNNGFSTADSKYTVYNSEAIFNTAHALFGGGTTKNAGTSNPTLSYTSMQEARTDFAMLKNERGRYVRTQPKCLATHPEQAWWAETLMQSSKRPGVANNDKNVLPQFRLYDAPYFSSTTAWFLLGRPKDLKMKFVIGDDPMTRKDFDVSTFNTVLVCYQAFRVEVYHYQSTWGSDGSGS